MNWPWVRRVTFATVVGQLKVLYETEAKEHARLSSELVSAQQELRDLKADPEISKLKKRIEIAELEGQLRLMEEAIHARREMGMPGERGKALIAKVQRVAEEERKKLTVR